MGVTPNGSCPLCENESESINHLFFTYRYSKNCLDVVLSWLGFNSKSPRLASSFKKIENVCSQGKSVWITLSCLVYQIWKTRNKAIWQAKFKSTQSIKKTIKMELKAHSYIIYIKENDRDTSWLYRTIYDVQFCCFMCYYYGILSYLMFSSYLLCT